MAKNEIKVTVKAKGGTYNFDNVREFCEHFKLKENAVYQWLIRNKDKYKRTMKVETIEVIFDRSKDEEQI